MLRALNSAASGMEALETVIDMISHNMANVNTTSFKKSVGRFQDLLYETVQSAGATTSDQTSTPNGLYVGQGVRTVASQRIYTLGQMRQSDRMLDMAINGTGFFRVIRPDGQFAYTRDGSFSLDSQGSLVTADGLALDPPVTVPPGVERVSIGRDGTVSYVVQGTSQTNSLGQITLTKF